MLKKTKETQRETLDNSRTTGINGRLVIDEPQKWMGLTDAAHVLRQSYQQTYDLALRRVLISRRNGRYWEVSRKSVIRLKKFRSAEKSQAVGDEE